MRDKGNIFCKQQAVTASAASSNDIAGIGPGDHYGEEVYFVVRCDEAATAAGAATVTVKLQTDTEAGDYSGAGTLYQSSAIAKADITVNKDIVKIPLPKGNKGKLRVYFEVGTGPLTAGKFSAYIVPNITVK